MEYKEYKYKRTALFIWLVMALLLFILAFIGYFLEDNLVCNILGVFSFLFGLFWIVLVIHAIQNPTLQTTEDEIIFSELPFVKTHHIPVTDIVKIKIQMDKFIWPRASIWYHYKDEIRQVWMVTQSLRKEDQVEFRTYLEDISRRQNPEEQRERIEKPQK
jgi:hypothetical protein